MILEMRLGRGDSTMMFVSDGHRNAGYWEMKNQRFAERFTAVFISSASVAAFGAVAWMSSMID